MATNKLRAYLCSCCFIDLVKEKVGVSLAEARTQEVWYIDQILKAHLKGEITAYTSTLTIAECTHVGPENITQDVRDLFIRFLTSGQYVSLIEPDVFVAEDARDLRWKHDIRLNGADALHVASALSVECTEFLTTDGTDGKPKSPISQASKLRALGLMPLKPSQTGLLSDESRQTDWVSEPSPPRNDNPPTTRRRRIIRPRR